MSAFVSQEYFFAVRNKNIDLEKKFDYNNDKKQLLWEEHI